MTLIFPRSLTENFLVVARKGTIQTNVPKQEILFTHSLYKSKKYKKRYTSVKIFLLNKKKDFYFGECNEFFFFFFESSSRSQGHKRLFQGYRWVHRTLISDNLSESHNRKNRTTVVRVLSSGSRTVSLQCSIETVLSSRYLVVFKEIPTKSTSTTPTSRRVVVLRIPCEDNSKEVPLTSR